MNKSDYFKSYSDLEVHKVMLNDIPRNEAYRDAIFSNKDYFKNKVVMDVGAGTGILSVYCAKCEASKVYAVEASDIITITKTIIEENNVQNIVEIIKGRVEDIEIPEKVDVIVSEWMGFYLLHEAMLDSVLTARDKFLKKDGLLFPNKCKLYGAPCTLPSFYTFWDDVNGVKMKSFGKELRKLYNGKPEITQVSPDYLLSKSCTLIELSLKELNLKDLNEIICKLFVVSNKNSKCQGMCLWFDVTFPLCDETRSSELILSTAPEYPVTHWKQTVIILPDVIELEENEPVAGTFTFRKNALNPRFYDLEFIILDPEHVEHSIPCECYFTKCMIIKALTNHYDEVNDEGLGRCQKLK